MIRIGLLSEGSIDETLLPYLLEQLTAAKRSTKRRPILIHFPYPSRGYGEIPKNLRLLMRLHSIPSEWDRIGCDLIVIVHDARGTTRVQEEIRKILKTESNFPLVYGLAIQEIEAWVLGDIENVNKHIFRITPCPRLPSAPEKDPNPKRTLETLFVKQSIAIDQDRWDMECARQVGPFIRTSQLERRCPRGFGVFANTFRRVAR